MESLAVASVVGLLVFMVGAISFAADAGTIAEERAAFSQAGTTVTLAGRSSDSSFERIYRIKSDAGVSFGALLALRSSAASAILGAVFSPQGELLDLSLVGSCSSRLPAKREALQDELFGADDAIARAADAVRGFAQADAEAGS